MLFSRGLSVIFAWTWYLDRTSSSLVQTFTRSKEWTYYTSVAKGQGCGDLTKWVFGFVNTISPKSLQENSSHLAQNKSLRLWWPHKTWFWPYISLMSGGSLLKVVKNIQLDSRMNLLQCGGQRSSSLWPNKTVLVISVELLNPNVPLHMYSLVILYMHIDNGYITWWEFITFEEHGLYSIWVVENWINGLERFLYIKCPRSMVTDSNVIISLVS